MPDHRSKNPVVPDGGWGWVIVACSFLIHFYVVGTLYALSVLFVSWLEAFQGGKGYTSWILSMAVAVMFGIGPLPALVAKRFNNRIVVIVGGLLMFVGFLTSAFAVNVFYLICSIGLVTGVGAGCCYLPSVSMVAMYFNKKRSAAMGIAASGLGVGAFVMPLYLNWTVDTYGWRGSMVILSGLSLNMCVLGLLMRPLEMAPSSSSSVSGSRGNSNSNVGDADGHRCDEASCLSPPPSSLYAASAGGGGGGEDDGDLVYDDDCDDEDCTECNASCRVTEQESVSFLGSCRPPRLHVATVNNNGKEGGTASPFSKFPAPAANNGYCVVHVESCSSKSSLSDSKQLARVSESDKAVTIQNGRLYTLKRDGNTIGGSLQYIKHSSLEQKTAGRTLSLSSLPRLSQNKKEHLPLASLSDIQMMMTGSLYNAVYSSRVVKSLMSLQSRGSTLVHEHPLALKSMNKLERERYYSECLSHDESDIADTQNDNQVYKKHTLCSKIMDSMSVHLSLMKHGTFMLFCTSNFLTNLSFFMPVLYMVDRAMHEGFAKDEAAMLVSLYGAGNIFGKLFFGWLADRGLVDRMLIYIGCLVVCGMTTAMSPLCGDSHALHSIYSFSFGCFIGSYCTLFAVVTVDLVGLEVVDESFGILLCFMGFATAFGAPLAGWIFDWTGSYTIAFILHGVFILMSVLILVPFYIAKRWKKK